MKFIVVVVYFLVIILILVFMVESWIEIKSIKKEMEQLRGKKESSKVDEREEAKS